MLNHVLKIQHMHLLIPVFFFLQCAEHVILLINFHFLQYYSSSNINNIHIHSFLNHPKHSLCVRFPLIYLTLHKNISRFLNPAIFVQRTNFLEPTRTVPSKSASLKIILLHELQSHQPDTMYITPFQSTP